VLTYKMAIAVRPQICDVTSLYVYCRRIVTRDVTINDRSELLSSELECCIWRK